MDLGSALKHGFSRVSSGGLMQMGKLTPDDVFVLRGAGWLSSHL